MEIFGIAPEHYGYEFGLNMVGRILGGYLSGQLVTRIDT